MNKYKRERWLRRNEEGLAILFASGVLLLFLALIMKGVA